MKRTAPANEGDADDNEIERATKRSRLAIVNDPTNASVANFPSSNVGTVREKVTWQSRKTAETLLRLAHLGSAAAPQPQAPPSPMAPPTPQSQLASFPVTLPASPTRTPSAGGSTVPAAADTPHALPAPNRHVDAAVRAVARPLPLTPAAPTAGKTNAAGSGGGSGVADMSSSANKKRIPWTEEETSNLYNGVERYGVGEWAKIMSTYKFHDRRRAVDLKDKWRNMYKAASGLLRRDPTVAATPRALTSAQDTPQQNTPVSPGIESIDDDF
jgi:hypothetical protein